MSKKRRIIDCEEKLWPDDADVSAARLAGRYAAKRGVPDSNGNRPQDSRLAIEWLIGHYEAKRNLRRFETPE